MAKLVLWCAGLFCAAFVARWLLSILRGGVSVEGIRELKGRGAQFVDVRTPAEYGQGHAEVGRNIPLDQLQGRLGELDRSKPVVVCCASGVRSASAKTLLEREGFTDVHNAGAWTALRGA